MQFSLRRIGKNQMERDPVTNSDEVSSSFEETGKGKGCTRPVRSCFVEMQHKASSGIFCGARWTNSVSLLKKVGAEILCSKMISFGRISTTGKPSGG
jgi:hypothetical protein